MEILKNTGEYDWIKDYSKVKDKLVMQVFDPELRTDLKDAVVWCPIDAGLAVCFRIIIEKKGDGVVSATVTPSLLREYDISVQELMADARRNQLEKYPPKLSYLSDRLFGMPEDLKYEFDSMLMIGMNKNLPTFGASCIIFSDFLKEVSKKLGGNFFMLPSSIHEVLFYPEGAMDVDALGEMVVQVNRQEVDPKEQMSNHVYYYDGTCLAVVVGKE